MKNKIVTEETKDLPELEVVLEDIIEENNETEKNSQNTDPFASTQSSVALMSTLQSSFVHVEDKEKASESQRAVIKENMLKIETKKIFESLRFNDDMVIVERMLSFNDNQNSLAVYKSLREKQPASNKPLSKRERRALEDSVGVKKLFSFLCPDFIYEQVIPRKVTCMTLNPKNHNLLAVGYGYHTTPNDDQISIHDTTSKHSSGVVCCWNLKNLSHPERIYITSSGVTSLSFSNYNTNLLAVGCFDGRLLAFDVRLRSTNPVMDSSTSMGSIQSNRSNAQTGNQRHTSAIWQTEWVERGLGGGDDKHENLVSISADGRVTQWSIRKGFENVDLMKLKRVTGKGTASAIGQAAAQQMKQNLKGKKEPGSLRPQKNEALISRQTPGLSFAFHPKDSNQYIVGTEEGKIHRCSCSYNEQYLETYHGHTGIVHKVLWSPFDDNVFLSVSSDWTARVWLTIGNETEKKNTGIVLNHGYGRTVNDCAWHPLLSSVFITLTDSDMRIFDIQVSAIDPIKIVQITSEFKSENPDDVEYPKLTKFMFLPANDY